MLCRVVLFATSVVLSVVAAPIPSVQKSEHSVAPRDHNIACSVDYCLITRQSDDHFDEASFEDIDNQQELVNARSVDTPLGARQSDDRFDETSFEDIDNQQELVNARSVDTPLGARQSDDNFDETSFEDIDNQQEMVQS
ncbi:uncharacterized protein EI97DRAFT_44678 [Westerdykella ornata]|uniref:Uncharacterized protein n=1 Tax=Westerdykella ornata TaxID=318751 RepID=A0A6A6JJZ7_WESOR|nr:uncharacterized protein EI97DRAFT_44678 [Westerdykella ornata]KAF2276584.1 hypothetical protein EI97DRAFT_44678 [Westerdykella ornata]